jgi:hypothetical protein
MRSNKASPKAITNPARQKTASITSRVRTKEANDTNAVNATKVRIESGVSAVSNLRTRRSGGPSRAQILGPSTDSQAPLRDFETSILDSEYSFASHAAGRDHVDYKACDAEICKLPRPRRV